MGTFRSPAAELSVEGVLFTRRNLFTFVLLPLIFLVVALAAVGILSAVGQHMYGDWRLVFVGWGRTSRLVTLWTVSLLSVGCIGVLFSYEQKLVSRQLGFTLLGLRMCLILTLFLTLLEPVWSWTYDESHRGRVLIAVDVSESMDTKDQFATRAEKLRWARALGVVGNDQNAERIENWITALEAGEEPQYVDESETSDPQERQRLEQARRENLEGVFQQMESLSRKEILQRLLLSEPNSVAQRLDGLVFPEYCAFASDVAIADEEELKKLFESSDGTVVRGRTDMTQPLVAGAGGEGESPLVGIIVFSDGRDNAHSTPQQFSSRFAGSVVPVHTVLIGSEKVPKDLAVANVEHPDKVFEDDDPLVQVTMRTSGFAGEQLQVRLESTTEGDGFEPLIQQVTPTGDLANLTFKLSDLPEGRHRFRLSTEVKPEETRDDNNDREFSIEVVDDLAKVLVLDGEGRWEFRYIEAALRRDERIELNTVVFEQPYMGVLPKNFFPRSLADVPHAPDQPSMFSDYDAILVGDVRMLQLNLDAWKQLDRYVREEGGTLILTAGKQAFPRNNTFDIVQDLLPVENLREVNLTNALQMAPPDRRGFHLELTPDGALQPMFQLDVDPIKNENIWSTLPGHTWGLIGEAKRTATVWAATPPQNGEEIGLEGERKRAVIAQQYVGTGQVVWMGIDSTWRWRFRVGDQYHHRFWGQLIRWSVDFKASSGNQFVRFGVTKPEYSTGEQIVLRTQWDERFLQQHPNLKVQAVITKSGDDESPVTIDLTQQEGQQLIFEGRHLSDLAGDYAARLKVEGVQLDEELVAEFSVNKTLSAELQDVSANRGLLEQAAQLTGGRFLMPDQLDQLPELFQESEEVTTKMEEVPIWNHWLVLILFCLFATTEWVLRKINGLP
ncbi:MAG: hypothetical protein KDA88_15500 [Planctomycetaceae bacterium]|nr:hypothetical protein [Planctomycetaceae bacterium]